MAANAQVHDPAVFAAAVGLVTPAIGTKTGDPRFDHVVWIAATPEQTRLHTGSGIGFVTVDLPTIQPGDTWKSIVSIHRNPLGFLAKYAADTDLAQSIFPDLQEMVEITKLPDMVKIEVRGATPLGRSTTQPVFLPCQDTALDWPHDLIGSLDQHTPIPTMGTVHTVAAEEFKLAMAKRIKVPFTSYSDGRSAKFTVNLDNGITVTGVVFSASPEPPSGLSTEPAEHNNSRQHPPVFVNRN